MKLLICPGLPRSGTTYLFEQLSKSGKFNVPAEKETNYFHAHNFARDTFLTHYQNYSPDRFCLDFSPSYLSVPPTIERIVSATQTGTEVKIVLGLRHPIDRAFAHYLHDLEAHVAIRDWGDSVYYPLFCLAAIKKYFGLHAQMIGQLVDAVGRENIFVMNFHRDLADLDNLRKRLSEFLDTDLPPFSNTRIGAGGWMPRYIYGGDIGMDIGAGGKIYTVPPDGLLLANGPMSCLWTDLPKNKSLSLLQASGSWTREFPHSWASTLRASPRAYSDFRETLALLKEDESEYPSPTYPMIASEPVIDGVQLPVQREISERFLVTAPGIEHRPGLSR